MVLNLVGEKVTTNHREVGAGRSRQFAVHMTRDALQMIDNIDHICQLAGNTKHVGIGTDLDGGFGKEQCPSDLETIADLQKIPKLLAKRGYSSTDIRNIMHGNFISFLKRVWRE